jgi:hypothetical protein
MALPLTDWPRQHYSPAGGDAWLFYVIYGDVDITASLSRGKYSSNGAPDGIDVMSYGPTSHPEVVASFREGYAWNSFAHDNPALAAKVAAQSNCLVIVGKVPDPPTLNYLRDAIGLLTFFLDAGGVAIYDPQILTWWPPSDWRRQIFDVGSPVPRHHVVILVSDDGGRTEWIHTRGMRKFGRPDLSIHSVPPQHKEAVIDLCNRFIEFLAFGGVIEDGQEIRMKSLPPGMKFFHRGNEEDSDFNNRHVEITWPDTAERNS